jgi:hypothetical protein
MGIQSHEVEPMSLFLKNRHFKAPSPRSWGLYLGLTVLTGYLVLLSG